VNEYVGISEQVARGLQGLCLRPTEPCKGCLAHRECLAKSTQGLKEWAKKWVKSLDFILGI